ncbi:queuosine precursor transporter [Peribacillus frigoritolerans]|uniref:queuosine precursor transporter n=1 Tax=Peribacillus frigoritolerans TaxID=450367 RepID=UPI00105A8D74|nr:queuosine precursor transporter [Peribacillus frigoritolerans]TDL82654.1 VUT family protein [Peribacillus frigoritolerans]
MPNEMLWLGFALINFIIVLLFYKLFGKSGLFVWIGFSTVVANLQVVKTIEIFGLTATMGNIMYGTAFLVTDILNEKYGEKEAKKAVWLGFATLISLTVIMQGVLLFKPDETDFAQGALETIFGLIPRIALGSLAAFIISQYADVAIYSYIRKKFPSDRLLWVRNNGSTMISQLIDTLIFTSIAFLGVYPFSVWVQIFITTYLIKFVVAIIDTPFAYLAKKMKPYE